jgi:hypothetical protein
MMAKVPSDRRDVNPATGTVRIEENESVTSGFTKPLILIHNGLVRGWEMVGFDII